jgi:hypothetical protein
MGKQNKNSPLTEHYEQQGYSVVLYDFIVGALGGWDPANERIINHLKLWHNYCRLITKLTVSDAISWSSDILIGHLSGIRQYQEETGGTDRDSADWLNKLWLINK